jgi:hypothetical protein
LRDRNLVDGGYRIGLGAADASPVGSGRAVGLYVEATSAEIADGIRSVVASSDFA